MFKYFLFYIHLYSNTQFNNGLFTLLIALKFILRLFNQNLIKNTIKAKAIIAPSTDSTIVKVLEDEDSDFAVEESVSRVSSPLYLVSLYSEISLLLVS